MYSRSIKIKCRKELLYIVHFQDFEFFFNKFLQRYISPQKETVISRKMIFKRLMQMTTLTQATRSMWVGGSRSGLVDQEVGGCVDEWVCG